MKYKILLFLALLTATGLATNIGTVTIAPQNLWLGDPLNITATCLNNAAPIDRVYTDITGPGILLPSIDLQNTGNNTFFTAIPGSYFDRRGSYSAMVYCLVNNTSVNSTASFTIDDLSGQINYLTTPVYIGNNIEIDLSPKKDNATITTPDLTFSVYLDGAQQALLMPAIYDTTKGWVLRLASPNTAKVYSMTINANYQGKTITTLSSLDVRNSVDFGISSVSDSSLVPNQNITLTLRAMNNGAPIQLTTGTMGVSINSVAATVQSVAQSGNLFNAVVTVPNISPGSYQLTASMTFNGSSYADSEPVNYITTLTGKLLDATGRPLSAQLTFSQSGTVKYQVNTLSDGTYATEIVPGTYDVDMDFGTALIHLNSANVNSFNDPVKYNYNSAAIDGLVANGIYTINVPWSFSLATVTLNYDSATYSDPSQVRIFTCSSWDSTNSDCNMPWTQIIPTINNNQAIFSVASLSAFTLGTQDTIKLSATFDKEKYSKGGLIKISGATYGRSQITNVTIDMRVYGGADRVFNSNGNGVFSDEFVGPQDEGNYTVFITAKKYPYLAYNGTYTIEVVSAPGAAVLFPGSVQVPLGGNTTTDLVITNTGQDDLTNVKLNLNLDSSQYQLGSYPSTIPVKNEIHVPVIFYSNENDTTTTISAALNFSSDQVQQTKLFGFTITQPKPKVQENSVTGFAFAMPSLDMNAAYAVVVIIALVVVVIFIKKIRAGRAHPPKIQNIRQSDTSAYLAEIKNYLNSRQATLGLRKVEEK